MKHLGSGSCAVLLCVFLFGCSTNRQPGGSAEKEILSTDDSRIDARARGDVETMSRIYADEYRLVTAEGVVRNKEDQIDEMRSQQLQFQPVVIVERTVRIYGDTALVLSRERASIIRNEQEIGGELQSTRVYVRRDGRWQLVLTHVTRIV